MGLKSSTEILGSVGSIREAFGVCVLLTGVFLIFGVLGVDGVDLAFGAAFVGLVIAVAVGL